MVCLPVRGDNPRALASGLSPVQMNNHWYNYFYTIYISVGLAHYEIFSAKVGKGGIRLLISIQDLTILYKMFALLFIYFFAK